MRAKGKAVVPMKICVEQECWSAAGQWSAKSGGTRRGRVWADHVNAGAGGVGTSCAMDNFPSVSGMSSHISKSHCFVAASR